MTDHLRDFAAREAQHAPPRHPARLMHRCPDCGRLHEVTAAERVCEDCAEAEWRSRRDWARLDWPGVGRGE